MGLMSKRGPPLEFVKVISKRCPPREEAHGLLFKTVHNEVRGICHASLVFSVYTRAFRWVCIRRKYKWQVASSTVSHEKALCNYFIPCLSLRKTYGNFGKSSEISVNFWKLQKSFKPIFEEFKQFIKLLENFGNSSKVFSRCFYDF